MTNLDYLKTEVSEKTYQNRGIRKDVLQTKGDSGKSTLVLLPFLFLKVGPTMTQAALPSGSTGVISGSLTITILLASLWGTSQGEGKLLRGG